MYVGGALARAVIREYEFYFPKKSKKNKKKKKSGQIIGESKQDRIKFDVLLTSYEMINLDSASLKPIQWECMVTFFGLLSTLLKKSGFFDFAPNLYTKVKLPPVFIVMLDLHPFFS